jgi:hypothetical protein
LLYQLSYELVQGRSFKTNTRVDLLPVEGFLGSLCPSEGQF